MEKVNNFHAVPAKFKCIWQSWNSHPEGEADQCCSLYIHIYKWQADFCVRWLLHVLLLALILLLQMISAQSQSKHIKSLFFGFTKSSGYKLQTMLCMQSGIVSRNLDRMFHCCLEYNFFADSCIASPASGRGRKHLPLTHTENHFLPYINGGNT